MSATIFFRDYVDFDYDRIIVSLLREKCVLFFHIPLGAPYYHRLRRCSTPPAPKLHEQDSNASRCNSPEVLSRRFLNFTLVFSKSRDIVHLITRKRLLNSPEFF